jgi:hypothetical protein
MTIFELKPRPRSADWDKSFGLVGIDENGRTFFNPMILSDGASPLCLPGVNECHIVEVDGQDHLFVPTSWARESFPASAEDFEKLDSMIRETARLKRDVAGPN